MSTIFQIRTGNKAMWRAVTISTICTAFSV